MYRCGISICAFLFLSIVVTSVKVETYADSVLYLTPIYQSIFMWHFYVSLISSVYFMLHTVCIWHLCFLPPALTWDVFLLYGQLVTNSDVLTVAGTWTRCCPHTITRWIGGVGKTLQLDPTHRDDLFILRLSWSEGHWCQGARKGWWEGWLDGGWYWDEWIFREPQGSKTNSLQRPRGLGSALKSQVPSVFNKVLARRKKGWK